MIGVQDQTKLQYSKVVRAIVLAWISFNLVFMITLDPIQKHAVIQNMDVYNIYKPETVAQALKAYTFFKRLFGVFFGSQYLVLTVLLASAFRKLIELFKEPNVQQDFSKITGG